MVTRSVHKLPLDRSIPVVFCASTQCPVPHLMCNVLVDGCVCGGGGGGGGGMVHIQLLALDDIES